MTDSILTSTKKLLGISADYTQFDLDILMHINSVFATLNQLGVGPETAFYVNDDTEVWGDLLGVETDVNSVKSYVYLKVRLLFDPPTTSFAINAMEKMIQEYEWRLNVVADNQLATAVTAASAIVDNGDGTISI